MTDFRCSTASEEDAEPIAGTAPTDTEWLFVEHPGPWGRKAVREGRLPEEVVDHLRALGSRVQLIRRHGGGPSTGVRIVTASLAGDPLIRTALIDDVRDLPTLRDADLTTHDDPLWLVCTNGRRDVCCAERGRPIAAALSSRWPEATWETTHLGGHRFAGTLLALPSGLALGRLEASSALEACAEILAGTVPLATARGRAGWPAAAQTADLHLRARHGWTGADEVRLLGSDGDKAVLATPDGPLTVLTRRRDGPPRRASCADDHTKPTSVLEVVEVTTRRPE